MYRVKRLMIRLFFELVKMNFDENITLFEFVIFPTCELHFLESWFVVYG